MDEFTKQYGPTIASLVGQLIAVRMAVRYIWKRLEPYLASHGRRLKRIEMHLELPPLRDTPNPLDLEPLTLNGRDSD